MFKDILLKDMDSNIVKDYILDVHIPSKNLFIGERFLLSCVACVFVSALFLFILYFFYVFPGNMSIVTIVALTIFHLLVLVVVIFAIVRSRNILLKWKILTEDEKVSRNNRKIRGEYLGTVIFAIGMPLALVIPRLNINFPVWVLAILSSSMILVLVYGGARCFYWYHLI